MFREGLTKMGVIVKQKHAKRGLEGADRQLQKVLVSNTRCSSFCTMSKHAAPLGLKGIILEIFRGPVFYQHTTPTGLRMLLLYL